MAYPSLATRGSMELVECVTRRGQDVLNASAVKFASQTEHMVAPRHYYSAISRHLSRRACAARAKLVNNHGSSRRRSTRETTTRRQLRQSWPTSRWPRWCVFKKWTRRRWCESNDEQTVMTTTVLQCCVDHRWLHIIRHHQRLVHYISGIALACTSVVIVKRKINETGTLRVQGGV